MEQRPTITPGIYEHYKGNRYQVIGVARHSETGEWMVVYEALYREPGDRLSVRPYDMFMENVEVSGIVRPRFLLID